MFHDLDVCTAPTEQVLQTLIKLGYSSAAFTTLVSSKTIKAPSLPSHPQLKILTRANITLSEQSQISLLSSANLNSFDLVAVRPTTEKLLQAVLNANIDIISIPLDRRSTYRLRRAHVHVAQSKGVRLELCYAHALRESRRNFFANAASVARITDGKQLLLSSGAASHMELRGADDNINLAGLFDVSMEHARTAVGAGAADVVKRGDNRARCHKGIVRVTIKKEKDDNMEE